MLKFCGKLLQHTSWYSPNATPPNPPDPLVVEQCIEPIFVQEEKRKRKEKKARRKQRRKDQKAGVLPPNDHDPNAPSDHRSASDDGNTLDTELASDIDNASDTRDPSVNVESSATGNDDGHATHQEVEGGVSASRLGYVWSMLDYFRATGQEASAATEHETASTAEDIEGTQDQTLMVTGNLRQHTAGAGLQCDEALSSLRTRDIDAAEGSIGEPDAATAGVDVAEAAVDGAEIEVDVVESEVDEAEIDVDTEFCVTNAAIDTANVDAAAAAKSNGEDEAKAANHAQHTDGPERTNEQTQDQQAFDQLEHQNMQVNDLHMQNRNRELLCPEFPNVLLTLKPADFAEIARAKRMVALSCHTLTDLLWRTVIFANYFSDDTQTEVVLPRNFRILPPEQLRFEIIVRESKLLGGPRNVPLHQKAVENDVVTFLSRILQIPEINMHDLAAANRDMSLKLQFNLRNKHVTMQKELFKLFTDN